MELHHLDWKKAETAGDRALLSIIAPTKDAATLSEQASLAFRRGDYVKVATITGFRMEDIYPMTQNLDEAWIDNLPEGVELSRPGPHRSTSGRGHHHRRRRNQICTRPDRFC